MAGDRGEAGGSLRLSALNVGLRLIAKPRLRAVAEPSQARWEFDLGTRLVARPPPYALWLPGKIAGPGGDLPVLHVSCGAVDRRKVILYLHGGAFVTGSPKTHRAMLARLSRQAGVPVFAPQYRLAPEHPFPAAVEDAEAAWRHLYDAGYDPEDVVVGGDSAGATIAFALLARLCQAGSPPAGAFGFSPFADLTGGSPSFRGNARRDPLLPAERLVEVVGYYLQGRDPADPEVSPVFAEFPGAPPVLLQHSETEILRDDAIRLAHRLRGFGAAVELQPWSATPHVWQLFDGWIPEARVALNRAARFVAESLKAASPSSGDS